MSSVDQQVENEAASDEGDEALVAIIGMAGRFPGAPDLERFWSNLAGGVESMRRFTDEELLSAGESPAALRDPGYVRVCPVLDDIDKFDAGFFGFSPKDAAIADPQHRIFLEVAWEAFENAGYDPARSGVVGVWAACGLNSYLMHHLVTNPDLMETVGEWLLRHTANDMNFLATRVSYELDLRGPSMNVQTACSSTLVTVHLAAQSLIGRECDLALAGGSTISMPQRGYIYKEGEILSSDGHCRPFDARSKGTLFGSGAGAVILKRLGDAKRDGDTILAVVRGSAINNDGSQKVGYLAPSVEGQARAIAEALTVSGVDARSISYVETHGTGTLIGDPIEVGGLTQAFRAHTDARGFCGIGSLKSNIGHLGEAAGIAGFIKTVLALSHGRIPPSAGYEIPNPNIDFAASPFFVVQDGKDWPRGREPRRAGVTALGAGGTNAHLILEEAPAQAPGGPAGAWQVLPISARSDAALDAATARLAEHLRAKPDLPLADVAHTLQAGRRAFGHRRVAVCRDAADAVAVLSGREPRRLHTQARARAKIELVFSFPGAGAQHAGMGQDLYETEPVFKAAVDELLEVARPELGADLHALLYPARDAAAREAASKRLEAVSLALPALFATEVALTRLLESWGITPQAMIGHSLGEYVAATVAGVLTPRDAMRLVVKRGLLIETLAPGGMVVVPLAPEELARQEPDHGLSIAAVNAPQLCVASGPAEAVAALEARLVAKEIDARRLHIVMLRALGDARPDPPRIRSLLPHDHLQAAFAGAALHLEPHGHVDHGARGVRPELLGAAPSADRALRRGARHAARPPQGLRGPRGGPGARAHQPRGDAEPEAGGGAADDVAPEGRPVGRGVSAGRGWAALDSRRRGRLGALAGPARRRRVPLPTYPFERNRYWIDRVTKAAATHAPGALKRKPDVADWFWLPSWARAPRRCPPSCRAARRSFSPTARGWASSPRRGCRDRSSCGREQASSASPTAPSPWSRAAEPTTSSSSPPCARRTSSPKRSCTCGRCRRRRARARTRSPATIASSTSPSRARSRSRRCSRSRTGRRG